MDPIPETKLSEALAMGSRVVPKIDGPVGTFLLSPKTAAEGA